MNIVSISNACTGYRDDFSVMAITEGKNTTRGKKKNLKSNCDHNHRREVSLLIARSFS